MTFHAGNPALLELEKLPADHPRRLVRNPEYMQQLYLTERLSIPKIAIKLGLSRSTVVLGLAQCAIPLRNKSESLKGIHRPTIQGSNNHNWKGGLSGWRKLARGRLNEHFVRPCMERDNFRCQWCGSLKKLVVHHHLRSFMEIVNSVRSRLQSKSVEKFVQAIVQEHRLEDGITLCKKCHDTYHQEHGK